jgi:hypothetical protein
MPVLTLSAVLPALAGLAVSLSVTPSAAASRGPSQPEANAIAQAVAINAPRFMRDPKQQLRIQRVRISTFVLDAASVLAGTGVSVQFARADVRFTVDPETGHRPGSATFALFRAATKGGFGTWKVYDISHQIGVGCQMPPQFRDKRRYITSGSFRQEYLHAAHDLAYAFFTRDGYYSCDYP